VVFTDFFNEKTYKCNRLLGECLDTIKVADWGAFPPAAGTGLFGAPLRSRPKAAREPVSGSFKPCGTAWGPIIPPPW
jgi:hypothetical protein